MKCLCEEREPGTKGEKFAKSLTYGGLADTEAEGLEDATRSRIKGLLRNFKEKMNVSWEVQGRRGKNKAGRLDCSWPM